MSRTYDPKEIAAWKAQIYGNIENSGRVEEWASTDQSHYTSPRKNVQTKWGSSKNNDSYSSMSASPGGDWLNGESPCGKKRGYKVKGEIKKPEL